MRNGSGQEVSESKHLAYLAFNDRFEASNQVSKTSCVAASILSDDDGREVRSEWTHIKPETIVAVASSSMLRRMDTVGCVRSVRNTTGGIRIPYSVRCVSGDGCRVSGLPDVFIALQIKGPDDKFRTRF